MGRAVGGGQGRQVQADIDVMDVCAPKLSVSGSWLVSEVSDSIQTV